MSNNKIFDYEVIIVGAGIAGISAAKILDDNNISNIVIEANNRVGGRAKKAPESFGNWFDLGCSYLHEGEINPFRTVAKSLNVPIDHQNGDIFSIEKTKYLFGEKPFLLNKKKKVKESYNNFLVKLNFYKENVEDYRLSTCLNINDPNYPILFDYLTGLNGIEANLVSARDFASVNEGKDLIIESGLANMIDKWATGINVILNDQVKQINWGRKQIEIYTKSKKYVCKSVLLTDKYHNNISEIFSFEIRKKEKEHMIFFFGGKKGSDIENYPKKYYKKIIEFIKKQFGDNIEKNIINLIHSSWGKDPYSKGAYSYALPGHNFERDLLKKTLEKKVYFAGEATINKTYGTCHGAYISGNHAANKIIYDLKN